MALKHLVLGVLARGPAHGYRLRREIEAILGPSHGPAPSRLYAVLRALRDARLLAAREETVCGRVRRVLEITARGRAEHRAWLERSGACSAFLRRPLLVKVALLEHLGAGAGVSPQLLRAERTARERALDGLRTDRERTLVARLCDGRLARHLEVELRLLERLAKARGLSSRTEASGSR